MKKNIKKIVKILLVMLVTLSTILNPISVFANSYALDMGTPSNTYTTGEKHLALSNNTRYNTLTVTDSSGNSTWDFLRVFKLNGEVVFCIQPLVNTSHGYEYTTGDQPSYITPAKKRVLDKIAWYGYGYNGDTSDKRLFATQVAIWELMDVSVSNISQELRDTVNEINNLVVNADKRPSFDGQKVTIRGYGEDYAVTLTDINGIISSWSDNFTIRDNNLRCSKNGNNLRIWATGGELENIEVGINQGYNRIVQPSDDIDDVKKMMFYLSSTGGQRNQDICRLGDPSWNCAYVKVNVEPYGTLQLTKQDNKGSKVAGVKFKLSYNSDMSDPIGTYTTNSNGVATIDRLLPKTVYYQEVSVPSHLVLDSTIKSINIISNQTVSSTVTNRWKQGYIKVVKKDKDTGKIVKKAGTKFDIYNSSNVKVTTITTNSNGVATSGLLDYGTYYVKESKAPNAYTVKVEVSSNIGVVEDGKTYEITISNKRTTGTINLSKEDSVTGKTPQGEATLKGAVYGLYAKDNIVDPSGDSTVLYAKDKLVKKLTTDENGDASVSNLYLGDYYLKELSASVGYNLDTTVYNISLDYENQNASVVTKKVTSKERVKSRAFSIIKISNNGTSGETQLLAGAEFTIKSQKDIDKYGSWEKAPIAKNAQGKTASKVVTDDKGYGESERLPYATYVVRETKTPSKEYAPIADFTVVINDDSSEPIPWRVFNDLEFTSVLAIVKQDTETQKTIQIPNATFKIKNLDTNEYFGYWDWSPLPHYVTSWTTDESGSVMTNNVLKPGNYQLEEIEGPNGYLISKTPVKFKISSGVAYETLPDGSTPVITVKFKDTSVKGKVTVEKKGEVLTDYKDGKFVYETRGLKGAVYEIYAKEDILDPSGDKTVLYKKDTLITTLTTGEDGKATSDELPLGKYYSKEVKAPYGHVLDTDKAIQDFELTYKDDKTALVYETLSYVNERQKVSANLYKVDSEENTVGLSGGEFNFIATKDILNADGNVIVKEGTVLGKHVSNDDGKIDLSSYDLPLDSYFELIETKAPTGYILNDEPIEFDTNYEGQDVETKVIKMTKENERTKIVISKTDLTTGEELEGNHLTIYEKENRGNEFISWVSTDKSKEIENLSVNTRYVLEETSSAKGFSLANSIEFELDEKGKLYIIEDNEKKLAEDNKIVMENDLVKGRLEWNKTGEVFEQTVTGQTEFGTTQSPVWKKSNILQSEITIYAGEDITLGNGITYYHKDDKIETLESDYDVVQSQDLLVGKYYYVETRVPHGYVADTDKHYFEIQDNQSTELQIVESTLNNNRPTVKLEFTKFMETFKHHNKIDDSYKDVVFGLYAREDIYDYHGNVGIENGSLVATCGIDENGQLTSVPDLPNGHYYIKELQTNDDYVLDEQEYDFEVYYHGKDVSAFTVTIGNGSTENKTKKGQIKIIKKDSFESGKKLENVEFIVSVNEDMSDPFTTVKTDKVGVAILNDMEKGKYYIQEKEQQSGYAVNNHVYEVEVVENDDLLEITVDNKPTEIFVNKIDSTTKQMLKGAILQILDKDSNIVDEWTSTDETHVINYLVENEQYILKEVSAPDGYEFAENINFTVKDGMTVIMQDTKKPTVTKTPVITSDNALTILYVLIVCITGGYLVYAINKKKKAKGK